MSSMQALSSSCIQDLDLQLRFCRGTWMAPSVRVPAGEGMARLRPLTRPTVRECSKPWGLPMASAVCPTFRPREVPTYERSIMLSIVHALVTLG